MKTCRLCLKVGIKMSTMTNTHKELIESLLSNNKIDEGCIFSVNEDHYVCYICAAYLNKTYNFLHMVMNAQKIYLDLTMNNQFTIETLQKIDRKENKLDKMSLTSFSIVLVNINNKRSRNEKDQEEDVLEGQGSIDIIKKCESLTPITDTSSCLESKIDCSGIINDEIKPENIEVSLEDKKEKTKDPLDLDNPEKIKPIKRKIKPIQKKIKPIRKKIKAIDNEEAGNTDLLSEAENRSLRKSIKKKEDEDYEPDSTSHSEDSDFDDYDDTGRRIMKPRNYDRKYPRKCDLCNYEVPVIRDHYRHYLMEHRGAKYPYEIPKIYPCSICGARKTLKAIHRHELEHTLKLNIKCEFCPKRFNNRTLLTRHRTTVHPKKVLTCDYCSKSFKTYSDIQRHIRTHTGEKPFICHICGAGFAHSGNRQIHIRSKHQNIRYVPKKRSQAKKPHKIKTKDLIDTEIESDDDDQSKRKKRSRKLRMDSKTKKRNPNGTRSSKIIRRSIKACLTKKKIVSKDQDQKKRKRVSDMESDDETLFELKSKMVLKSKPA